MSLTAPTVTQKPIVYWNRAASREETETVYGESWVRWLYETKPGQSLGERLLSRAFFSRFYGGVQDSAWSARKVAPFVKQFGIPMDEYEDRSFTSFNDFFTRQFRPGMRRFAPEAQRLPAPCEARYFAFSEVRPEQQFPIKGSSLSVEALIGDAALARPFMGGPLLLARLCPVDYHRFHYPADGRTIASNRRSGRLHSVNPVALRHKPDILITNERHVSILDTPDFGRLAYIEVGALCVGKIVQTHAADQPFRRGDEKGYFLFGGSTVILIGQKGRWLPDADLLEQTATGRETLVRLGDGLARAHD